MFLTNIFIRMFNVYQFTTGYHQPCKYIICFSLPMPWHRTAADSVFFDSVLMQTAKLCALRLCRGTGSFHVPLYGAPYATVLMSFAFSGKRLLKTTSHVAWHNAFFFFFSVRFLLNRFGYIDVYWCNMLVRVSLYTAGYRLWKCQANGQLTGIARWRGACPVWVSWLFTVVTQMYVTHVRSLMTLWIQWNTYHNLHLKPPPPPPSYLLLPGGYIDR